MGILTGPFGPIAICIINIVNVCCFMYGLNCYKPVVPFDPASPLDPAYPQGQACHLGTAGPLLCFLGACLVPCLSEVRCSGPHLQQSLSAGHLAFPLETHLAEAFQGCRLLAFDSCSACSLLLLPHHFLQDVGCWGSAFASRPSRWPVQAGRRAASGLPCLGLPDLANLVASSCC